MVCIKKNFPPSTTSNELVFLQAVEYNSYFAGACISWRRDANGGAWQPYYRITDHLGSTRLETSANGTITAAYDYKPFGEQIPLMTTTTRKTYIGKERDDESYLGDFGVRKYDYAAGRFTSPDVLWEKYIDRSPYNYCGNNPISLLDDDGRDERQRQGALDYATSYLNSGSTYKISAKGLPGSPVDCSGLVNNSVVMGGNEPSLVGRKGVTGTGVQQIEKVTTKIDDINSLQPGNIVTFLYPSGWGFHTGLVKEPIKNSNGDIVSFTYIHSSSSKIPGPKVSQKDVDDPVIKGFYKWDTIPDQKPLIFPTSIFNMKNFIKP